MDVLVLNPPREVVSIINKVSPLHNIRQGNYAFLEVVFTRSEVSIYWRGKDLREFDFTWVSASWSKRDLAYAISLYLQHHKRKHTVITEGRGHSKLVDMMLYALNGVEQPRSYFCTQFSYPANIDSIIAACGLPVIGKDVYGTYGRNSFMARTRQELIQELRNNIDNTNFIFQEYMEHDFDWGVLVGRDKVLSAERTYRPPNSSSFMNHDDPGITEEFAAIKDVPPLVKKMARKANTILGLDWGRSDIIHNKHDNKPYMLETNRSPRVTAGSTEEVAYTKYLINLLQEM